MKITFLLVGRTVKGWVSDALEIYRSRLVRYVNFEIREIPDLKNAGSMSREQVKLAEGELILKNVRPDDKVILLDERGEECGSIQWASRLESLIAGGRNVVFVTGGPYGFSEAVYARADSMMSLSRMTFPHQMVRVIFTEQLYRAFTIIRREPYHHE